MTENWSEKPGPAEPDAAVRPQAHDEHREAERVNTVSAPDDAEEHPGIFVGVHPGQSRHVAYQQHEKVEGDQPSRCDGRPDEQKLPQVLPCQLSIPPRGIRQPTSDRRTRWRTTTVEMAAG